jgi:MoxR-like ATPase
VDLRRFSRNFERIVANVNEVIHGKDDVVRLSMIAICAGGHILFEDVPGVGKSMLARAIAQSMEADVNRVQCTPDMLPGDITGSSIIDTKTMSFVFRPGPVFANVLLVDEVNRATPKTQSALLEAMAEKRVTVDGVTRDLPKPFFALATQNPVELAGTFPLPEAQLDRFLFKLSIGYPDHEAERAVIRGNARSLEVDSVEPVVTTADVVDMTDIAADVVMSSAVEDYIIQLVHATREEQALTLGAGPRASIAMSKAAKVMAAADGRDSVYAEDVRALLTPVLNHRLMLTPDAVLRGETAESVLERVVARVKPPLGVGAPPPPRRESAVAERRTFDDDDAAFEPRPDAARPRAVARANGNGGATVGADTKPRRPRAAVRPK